MIKNRKAQIVFQTVYCVLAVVGFLASLGLFNADFNEDFYVYYTNLSNYICMVFIFILLVKNIKKANRKEEDKFSEYAPQFNFMCVIMITITCLVYNILLVKDNTVVSYFTSLSNLLLHVILPIMFVLNWVLFYEHGKAKWHYPLWSLLIPFVYVVYILIRARIIGSGTNALLYPYFFLDIGELGWGGFFMWIGILLVAFTALGYIFYAFDHFKAIKNKLKKSGN